MVGRAGGGARSTGMGTGRGTRGRGAPEGGTTDCWSADPRSSEGEAVGEIDPFGLEFSRLTDEAVGSCLLASFFLYSASRL